MKPTFLDTLDQKTRARVNEYLVEKTYERDQFVISHMDEQNSVFIVLTGRAQVRVYSSDGKVVAFRTVEQGGIFGELSAIDGQPRSASVQALEQSVVGRLEPSEFRELVDNNKGFAWALLTHIAAQVRDMTARTVELRIMKAPERLRLELLRLAEHGTKVKEGTLLPKHLTHQELALRVGSQREEATREIGKLVRQKILKKSPDGLIIVDLARLRGLLDDST